MAQRLNALMWIDLPPRQGIGLMVHSIEQTSRILTMEIELKELVELLARYLANHPEQICVEEIRGSRTSVLLLKASREDISGIIGKDGRNAEAMRTILTATASRLRKKALLEILD